MLSRTRARRCGSANSCIFADVVPVALRSTVYAFDRSFEGAVGACAAPLVGAPQTLSPLSFKYLLSLLLYLNIPLYIISVRYIRAIGGQPRTLLTARPCPFVLHGVCCQGSGCRLATSATRSRALRASVLPVTAPACASLHSPPRHNVRTEAMLRALLHLTLRLQGFWVQGFSAARRHHCGEGVRVRGAPGGDGPRQRQGGRQCAGFWYL